MTARLSKFMLTAHIISSLGWFGAVAAFLVLSIAGRTSHDGEVVRSSYVAMYLIGVSVIVPLSLAALLTGLVQSLGTHWGLFRQYWVVTKFLLTIFGTVTLLHHQFSPVAQAAKLVSGIAAGTLRSVALAQVGTQLLAVASVAILLLLVVTALSVYKPWGLTPYGRRKQLELRERLGGTRLMPTSMMLPDPVYGTPADGLPVGLKAFMAVIGVLVAAFVVLHLTGHSLHHGQ
jgi:hypothetical protein